MSQGKVAARDLEDDLSWWFGAAFVAIVAFLLSLYRLYRHLEDRRLERYLGDRLVRPQGSGARPDWLRDRVFVVGPDGVCRERD